MIEPQCEEIIECKRNNNTTICDNNSLCTLIISEEELDDINNIYECICNDGYEKEFINNETYCIDINECVTDGNICNHKAYR